jgi:putative transposase
VHVDTAEIFGCAYNWTAEREECIRGDELWNKKKPDGARTNFLGTGYCVSTVGLDEETIREYIRNQEQVDKRQEEFGF